MERLDEKISQLLMGLPEDLKRSVLAKVDFYKSKRPAFSNKEIYFEARDLVELEMVAYLDRRDYLGLYNRRFLEHVLKEHIVIITGKAEAREEDLFGLVRIHFDLNGLKALNDLAGHDAGNEGLKIFGDILKNGKTTRWLTSEGYHVTSAGEGGDEFGVVLAGLRDVRPIIDQIREGYTKELEQFDSSRLINFKDPKVREALHLLGIADEVPESFVFKLTTSFGLATFGEALGLANVHEEGKSFNDIVRMIIGTMFRLSDERAREHKSAYKAELSKTNPVLSGIYARMSREVVHLEREIAHLKDKINALEEQK